MKRFGAVIGLVCLTIFLSVCAICGGLFISWLPSFDEDYTFSCELIPRGNDLVAKTDGGSTQIAKTLFSPVKFEVVKNKKGETLVIKNDQKTYYHTGPAIQQVLSSPKEAAIYFIQAEKILAMDARFSHVDSRVWKWDRKDGFRPLTRSFYHLSELEFSLKEDALVVGFDPRDEHEPKEWLVYLLANGETRKVFPPNETRSLVMVDNENFLLRDWSEVALWNPTTGLKNSIGTTYLDVAAFQGSIWAVRSSDPKQLHFEVVKLDKDYKEVGPILSVGD